MLNAKSSYKPYSLILCILVQSNTMHLSVSLKWLPPYPVAAGKPSEVSSGKARFVLPPWVKPQPSQWPTNCGHKLKNPVFGLCQPSRCSSLPYQGVPPHHPPHASKFTGNTEKHTWLSSLLSTLCPLPPFSVFRRSSKKVHDAPTLLKLSISGCSQCLIDTQLGNPVYTTVCFWEEEWYIYDINKKYLFLWFL